MSLLIQYLQSWDLTPKMLHMNRSNMALLNSWLVSMPRDDLDNVEKWCKVLEEEEEEQKKRRKMDTKKRTKFSFRPSRFVSRFRNSVIGTLELRITSAETLSSSGR
ncbi:hypothetical protein L1987_46543 [Smallanthus sonchifolius]|uniref:Uncharacterized protein n=1 Tax=Smallanthus sonchifolius TaxID=185202 RepID=A0ACB9FZG9_9ASTR|nr:hypothetical protein L1987_46543 [Smallanthus sonchifolius]